MPRMSSFYTWFCYYHSTVISSENLHVWTSHPQIFDAILQQIRKTVNDEGKLMEGKNFQNLLE